MFPTTHDIFPENLAACGAVLVKLLDAGNEVLLVSKPRLSCISQICSAFACYKKKLAFRFTIGAFDDDLLSKWEPGAPPFEERLACLKLAKSEGFQTSVSCEPLLQPWAATDLYFRIEPHVTDSIWFGKLNRAQQRVKPKNPEQEALLRQLLCWQEDKAVWGVYTALKDAPKVKWKESYKKVVGIPLATEAGTDE